MAVIGVDIGGTKIAAGLVKGKKIVKKAVFPTPKTRRALINTIIASIGSVYNKKAEGIGIGVAGSVDEKGVWLGSINIPSVKNIRLKKIIQKKFRKKVMINNDAACFALAESAFGQGKSKKSVFGLILGTGVGGGIVINDELFDGANCLAGEVGMIRYKGKILEDFCAGRFIKAMAGKYKLKKTKPRDVEKEAEKGNKKAKKIFAELGEKVGYLISIIINVLNPEIIVLGGGVSDSFELFKKSMFKSMKKNIFYPRTKKTRVVKTRLRDVGILGAAALCSQQ